MNRAYLDTAQRLELHVRHVDRISLPELRKLGVPLLDVDFAMQLLGFDRVSRSSLFIRHRLCSPRVKVASSLHIRPARLRFRSARVGKIRI